MSLQAVKKKDLEISKYEARFEGSIVSVHIVAGLLVKPKRSFRIKRSSARNNALLLNILNNLPELCFHLCATE